MNKLAAATFIANQPESIWEKHLRLAAAALAMIAVLAIATVLLTLSILRRRRVERALRQSELRFQSLFDNMAEGVALHEMIYSAFGQPTDYRLLAVNAAFERILKLKAEAVIGKTATEVYGTAQAPFLVDYAAVVASRMPRRLEVYFEPMRRYFAISVAPWGERGFATIFADVTEQRLIQERLRQSEKMEAIGQLAGGIAHDFNNQLAGIIGYAEILERRADDDKTREFVRGILTAAQRAVELIQKLLAFSRKGKYRIAIVDLNHLIAEVVAILERSIDKRITIQQRLSPKPALTRGDPTQLQNAILNLALNARDAMPQGGELILATELLVLDAEQCRRLSAEIAPGPYVRLTVTDSGCGMSDEVKRHLFEPFFTTKPPGEGTGMGLASVYGTVRSHEGAITVYSEPGQGTTFRLYLPSCEAKEDAGQASATTAMAPRRGQGNILVIDDEEVCRNMLSALLDELGYRVTVCGSGREAIELYRQRWQETNLVILDLIMPEMNGRQVFAALRQINPQAKVIITSAHSLNGVAQAILDACALAFISKPFQGVD
ncbi:MAG: response regulator, partial [Planctomycetota bacterium]|nr:response regulator [Planctomycetota bacterium]